MAGPELVVARGSALFARLRAAAAARRSIFVMGLPAVGKSLITQQLAVIASELGRAPSLLRWDRARLAFETPAILARYPEVESVTDPAIRRATGLWARAAIARWDATAGERAILIGEVPLVGGRLIEIALSRDDSAEPLLASELATFLVPVPTRAVRAAVEAARAREMAEPSHAHDASSAPPAIVDAHWREIATVARELGVATGANVAAYDPDLYAAVYLRLLRDRHAEVLPVDEVLPVSASAQELPQGATDLTPDAAEVERAIGLVDARPREETLRRAARWYALDRTDTL